MSIFNIKDYYNNENYKVKLFVMTPRLVSFGPDDVDTEWDEEEIIVGMNRLDIETMNRTFGIHIRGSLADNYFTKEDLDNKQSHLPRKYVFVTQRENKLPEGTLIDFEVLDMNVPHKISDEDKEALMNL